MSNETPAQLLAAVLRVVAPGRRWLVLGDSKAVHGCSDDPYAGIVMLWPNSKDDLARVVAMLTPEQRSGYDCALVCPEDPVYGNYGGGSWSPTQYPSKTMLASASDHLAAIVAATGVKT